MTDTPKRGRPPKHPDDRRRGTRAIAVKFSVNEYRELSENAKDAGVSVPTYILLRCRG